MDEGMTDRQFKGFIRLLLINIKDANETAENEKTKEKLAEIIENLQATLED